MLYEAIKNAEPASPIHGYREVENRRCHYEKLARQPDNLLVSGDAACAFNPVYGQGMTAAALGAETLEACLQGRHDGDFAGLSRRFQKKLAKVDAAPWLPATGEDFRVRGTEGGKASFSTRLTHRYMDRVLELSLRDLAVRRTFLQRRSKQLSDQRTGSVGGKLCGHRLAPCRGVRSTLERQLN